MFRTFCSLLISLCFSFICTAQKITYSQPERDDVKTMNFDVIGKIDNHYIIHKNNRNDHRIAVYDSSMKMLEETDCDFLPDKVLSTDILAYRQFFYLFYQFQKRNIVYCMGAKIGGDGKIIGKPKLLDTTAINFFTNDKLYNIINSEDKQKIMVFKINSKNTDRSILTASLFDVDLNLIHRSRIDIPMLEKSDFLSEFNLDNDGQFIFIKPAGSSQEDNITQATLVSKNVYSDTLSFYPLTIPKIYLDNIQIKVDNINKRYILASFYSKIRRGNIEGLYCIVWDRDQQKQLFASNTTFSEEVRSEAKSEGNTRTAFNDFYVENILVRKDGGFAIVAESIYSSSRGVYNNRWDYYNYPYLSPYNYYYYSWSSPLYYNSYFYPWWRWGPTGQINRYYADNIAVMSFDSTASEQWTNIIHKSQYDDYTDNFIGYGTLNTGDQFHFLFNQLERRALLLTDQSITPDGQVLRSPTLRNLDKDYQFMPRFGKQVSSRELIIPCQYRNFICFAKVEF